MKEKGNIEAFKNHTRENNVWWKEGDDSLRIEILATANPEWEGSYSLKVVFFLNFVDIKIYQWANILIVCTHQSSDGKSKPFSFFSSFFLIWTWWDLWILCPFQLTLWGKEIKCTLCHLISHFKNYKWRWREAFWFLVFNVSSSNGSFY